MHLYLFSGLRFVTGLFHGCCCVSFQLRSLLWTSDQMWPQSEVMEVISVGWLSEVDEGEIKLFPRIGENCCAEASERAGAGRARVCAFVVGILGAKQQRDVLVGNRASLNEDLQLQERLQLFPTTSSCFSACR